MSISKFFRYILVVLIIGTSVYAQKKEVSTAKPTVNKTVPVKPVAKPIPKPSPKKTSTSIASIYNDGNINYATSQMTFSLVSGDSIAGRKFLKYKIDSGNYEEYKNAFNIKDEGMHTVHYNSIDNVGNQTPDTLYSVIIDNTPPDVIIVSSAQLFSKDGKVYAPAAAEFTLKANDLGCGVKSVMYAIDKGNSTAYASSIKFSITGDHSIAYKASDNLGNTSQEKTFKIFIDSNKPLVKITPSGILFEKAGKKYAPAAFQYSIEAADTESGISKVLVSIDNGKYVFYENPIVFSKEGEHSINAKAIDNVGNESAGVSVSIVVDSTPPKVELKPGN